MEDSLPTGPGARARVMVVQTRVSLGRIEENLHSAIDLASRDRMPDGVDVVVFPEFFATGFDFPNLQRDAGMISGLIPELSELAIGMNANILFSIPWQDGPVIRNRTIWMDRMGSIRGHYDKTHLFSRSPEGGSLKGGDRLVIFGIDGWMYGVLTCYEVRYPHLSTALVSMGADVLVYPAQWPTSRIHQWDHLLRARAIESQVFVLGANLCGEHGEMEMGGRSCIVEPFGTTLARLDDRPGAIGAVLDRKSMDRFRRGFPVRRDLRSGLPVEIVT